MLSGVGIEIYDVGVVGGGRGGGYFGWINGVCCGVY